jgi:hypothetical protein
LVDTLSVNNRNTIPEMVVGKLLATISFLTKTAQAQRDRNIVLTSRL